jgi:hypothetical protein
LANLAKSGLLTMRVAKFPIEAMMPLITPQTRSDPCRDAGLCTIGPMPCALTIAQAKNTIPAVGTTYALTVNKCRILCTGNHRNGSDPNQKRKKETKSRVLVPDDLDMVFLLPSGP